MIQKTNKQMLSEYGIEQARKRLTDTFRRLREIDEESTEAVALRRRVTELNANIRGYQERLKT